MRLSSVLSMVLQDCSLSTKQYLPSYTALSGEEVQRRWRLHPGWTTWWVLRRSTRWRSSRATISLSATPPLSEGVLPTTARCTVSRLFCTQLASACLSSCTSTHLSEHLPAPASLVITCEHPHAIAHMQLYTELREKMALKTETTVPCSLSRQFCMQAAHDAAVYLTCLYLGAL